MTEAKFELKTRIYKALGEIAFKAPHMNELAAEAAYGYWKESNTIDDLQLIIVKLGYVVYHNGKLPRS